MPALGLRAAAVNKTQGNSETISSWLLSPPTSQGNYCMQQFFRGVGWWFKHKWLSLQSDTLGYAAVGASAESELGILAGRREEYGIPPLPLVHLIPQFLL